MVLDRKRLGKQRLECVQIVSAIRNGGGWARHPAVRMWRDHLDSLRLYHDVCVREWVRRGYVNNMPELLPPDADPSPPPWLGDEAFHSSHRAALLDKAPELYSHYGWTERPALAYIWPVP